MHYFVTNNLAAEQRALGLAFKDITRDNSIKYFLYYIYFELILIQNLANEKYKEIKSHLYTALYLCYIKTRCEESILAAIVAALMHAKTYIK